MSVGSTPPAKGAASETGFPRERRFIFVQLLFSLTAAEIARQTAELVLQHRPFCLALPAYAHLFLATAVVATSWVGWSVSEASRRVKVDFVFDWPFVILLTDVALVIFYFILVRGAEIPKLEDPISPSSHAEAVTLAFIFTIYFFWDILTKAIMSDGQDGTPSSCLGRFTSRAFWDRAQASLVCMVLGIIAALFWSSHSSPAGVVLVDAALICLVLLFRAMKEKRKNIGIALAGVGLITSGISFCFQ